MHGGLCEFARIISCERRVRASGGRGRSLFARPGNAGCATWGFLALCLLLQLHGPLSVEAAEAAEATAGSPASLTLDRLFQAPSLFGTPPDDALWSPAGDAFVFRWNDSALPQRELWLATVDAEKPRRLFSGEASVREAAWLADGSALLCLRGESLWRIDVRTGASRQLVRPGSGAAGLSISPDGRFASWLQHGDLWRFALDGAAKAPEQLTDLGLPPLSPLAAGRYRRPEREIGPGIWGGPTYAWSPDGRYLALHAVDRRQMRTVPFPDYLAPDTQPNPVRRGYPGDPNERREVGILDLQEGAIRWLALPDPSAYQIVGFAWSADQRLLVDVASDTAVDRRIYVTDSGGATPRLIWRSERTERIYTRFAALWMPDSRSIAVLSDHEDRYGVYRLNLIDGLTAGGEASPERLSDPAHDVLGDIHFAADGSRLFYSATGDTPAQRHLFSVALAGVGAATGPRAVQLSRRPGQHEATLAPDARHAVLRFSDDRSPPELYLLRIDDGRTEAPAARITHSPPAEFARYPWAQVRYLSVPSRIDDYTLGVRLMLPADFDPERRYPVIFGPLYSNTVRNRWAGIYTAVQQLLVQRGFLVAQVDVRGSTGYGRAFREAFLADFAGDDIEDLHSAVDYLAAQPWVDSERLGLWGSSYGGTLTLYTLLRKPGLFRAGVAAAAAVDPHFFGTDDVAIVRRPDTHPEIFERRAAALAGNLEDALLLIHGMQDQVVPFKTMADFSEALIRAGKDFDTAFVPGATHAWSREPGYDRYLFGRLLAHFERHLMPRAQGEALAQ